MKPAYPSMKPPASGGSASKSSSGSGSASNKQKEIQAKRIKTLKRDMDKLARAGNATTTQQTGQGSKKKAKEAKLNMFEGRTCGGSKKDGGKAAESKTLKP